MNFDYDSHTYTNDDGVDYRSVTTILKDEGHIDTRWYTEAARKRGEAVHEITEAMDAGVVKAKNYAGEEVSPYVIAYENFRNDLPLEVVAVEKMVWSDEYRYAGKLDRLFKTPAGELILLDIKTGNSKQFWHGLQLAAYEAALGEPCAKRILFLNKNGKYSLSDGYKDILFGSPMWSDYWQCIVKKSVYDREYLK